MPLESPEARLKKQALKDKNIQVELGKLVADVGLAHLSVEELVGALMDVKDTVDKRDHEKMGAWREAGERFHESKKRKPVKKTKTDSRNG